MKQKIKNIIYGNATFLCEVEPNLQNPFNWFILPIKINFLAWQNHFNNKSNSFLWDCLKGSIVNSKMGFSYCKPRKNPYLK